MESLAVQFITGLAGASALFLVACGLSIIFGVTRIVNFAHGSFYMLGAYLAVTLTTTFMEMLGGIGFWLGLLVSAAVVGAAGAAMEVLILRRLYRAHELFQLLATFGVVLIVQDMVLALWGPQDLIGPRAPRAAGSVSMLGARVPAYDLVLIAVGPLVLGGLWLLFTRTRWGVLVRAATQDREMLGALGVNQTRLFTSVLFLGAALAGLGGALQIPREAASLGMDLNIIAEAFVVTVVGGMGSILGPFLAALLVAQLNAFGILILPQISIVLLFLVMAVVLVLRPHGLMGRPEDIQPSAHPAAPPVLAIGELWALLGGLLLLAGLALLPLVVGAYALTVASEILIFALFAASLQLIMGLGGLISFGHALYLGLGAYAAALLTARLGAPMSGALAAAPVAGALGAMLVGWFCVRLSGVYLAMLTLAFAQIGWSVAHQWTPVTGGDNGILGVWPALWVDTPVRFYFLTLLLCGGAIAALRRIGLSPFGYLLRAGRDSPQRAAALGVDLKAHRWAAFTLAGAFAGLAGGLYAFLKGSVFPEVAAIAMSVDALVMVLLGGVATLTGPLAGAAVYDGVKAELVARTEVWRVIIGGGIVLLCVAFPNGIVGQAQDWWRTRREPA